uniref:Glycine-rich RNA-binding protein 2, mitochondrial n=1 Tax=Anthurium amnicola TaxID=1678845 RepID=A0A1D1XWF7_9ARAE
MAAFRRLSRLYNSSGTTVCLHQNSRPLPAQLVPTRGVASKLFVAGLSYFTTEQGLSEAFSQCGQVLEAKIAVDRGSGRSKGFGFVTFACEDEAEKAISEMNGKVLNGRTIYVETSKPIQIFQSSPPIARGPPDPSSNG